jgi:hypothetical protein
VAVTVEDGQGRPIDGLTARDVVTEDSGRRQRIDLFARMGEGRQPVHIPDVALLVDTSDSMLERCAGRRTWPFLSSLPNAQEILVSRPDPGDSAFRPGASGGALRPVRTLPEGGNTAVRDAIASACARYRDRTADRPSCCSRTGSTR